MKPWKRIEPTKVTKVGWRSIVTKTFKLPDGQKTTFDIFGDDGVHHTSIVALTPDHKVIIAEQFRQGPEKVMMDLPGGTVDSGEDPDDGVAHELLEETCYVAKRIEKLGSYNKDAYMNATWHYYLAWDCELKAKEQDVLWDELINTRLISIKELIETARKGQMTESHGVFLAQDKLSKLMS